MWLFSGPLSMPELSIERGCLPSGYAATSARIIFNIYLLSVMFYPDDDASRNEFWDHGRARLLKGALERQSVPSLVRSDVALFLAEAYSANRSWNKAWFEELLVQGWVTGYALL